MSKQQESLEHEVWRKAIAAFEREVMDSCPVLVGGRRSMESVENYANRCVAGIAKALWRLSEAREKYFILYMEAPDANRK